MPNTTARHQVIPVVNAEYGVTIYEVRDTEARDAFDTVARFGDEVEAERYARILDAIVTTATLTERTGVVNPYDVDHVPAGYVSIRVVWHAETFHYLFPFDGRTATGPAIGRARQVSRGVYTSRTSDGRTVRSRVGLAESLAALVG